MLELTVRSRQELGKKTKRVRREGNIPAVLYGYNRKPAPVQVEARLFQRVWKEAGETSLVSLVLNDGSKQTVLIHDVSRDVLRGMPTHIDFYAVRMDRPIEASIPLVFTGESDAVRALGGVLIKVAHELAVRALPKDLPHEVAVDITPLRTFDDQLFVKDIPLPNGVEALVEEDRAIALVEAPRTEEELAAIEQPADVSLDTIEVAGEKKEEGTEEESKNESS